MKTIRTHENYIADVMAVVLTSCTAKEKKILSHVKLAYGAGPGGTRGITFYDRWKNGGKKPVAFVEICASGESSLVQICGTTFHESAHVLAGFMAAHGKDWKAMCEYLGLLDALAAGMEYKWTSFKPEIAKALKKIKAPNDGSPTGPKLTRTGQPYKKGGGGCSHGQGSRGGKSRGVGSGSRQVLVTCSDCGCKARLSRQWIAKGLPYCGNDDHGEKRIRMSEPS